MCLGENAQQDHKGILSSSTNFIKKLTSSHRRQLNGRRIEDFIGIADEAMIRLGIENNIYEKDGVLQFGNNCGMLKYTSRSQVGRSGSWPIECIAHYE